MPTNERPKRDHYRGKPRLGRHLDVRFRPTVNEAHMTVATTENIGSGGAFIICESPLPVGTEVLVSLALPTKDVPVDIVCEVRWIVSKGDAHAHPGMGVAFVDIGVDTTLDLNAYFASLTGADDLGADDL